MSMKKQFLTVQAGGESFPASWDMTALATFEKLAGSGNAFEGIRITASNVLDALWAGIDAAAAHNDQPAPITRRRLGTLFSSMDDASRAIELVTQLIGAFMPEATPAGKAEAAAAANPSPSPGATSSQPSISESVTATSGV